MINGPPSSRQQWLHWVQQSIAPEHKLKGSAISDDQVVRLSYTTQGKGVSDVTRNFSIFLESLLRGNPARMGYAFRVLDKAKASNPVTSSNSMFW